MREKVNKAADSGKARQPGIGRVFAAAALMLVGSIAVVYWIGLVAVKSTRQLGRQREVIGHLEGLLSTLKDAETGQRGYLLTGEARYLEPYNEALAQVNGELEHLGVLAAQGELPEREVKEVSRLSQEKLRELERTVEARREGELEEALGMVRSGRGKSTMDGIRSQVAAMKTREVGEFEAASQRAERTTYARSWTFLVATLVNLGFLGWAYRRVESEIRKRERAQEQVRRSHAELEQRVKERTAELTAANKELEAFGYSVSHDLRAPLRHVSSYIKLLDKGSGASLDEKGRRQVRTIAEAAQRMGQLIDDLLVLSRIGRATVTESNVSLRQLVDEARKELAPEMASRLVEWQVGPLPQVRGDANLLRSAVVNLLSNALKYSRGRNPARIELGSEARDGEVVCFVKDNGAGFDMRFIEKLFGVFQRLHDQEQFEGTGIGLASLRRVIQRHGGRTWAEGAVERGATFYFSIPRERIVSVGNAEGADALKR